MSETSSSTIVNIFTTLKKIIILSLNIIWAIIEATYRFIIPVPEKSVSGEIVLITGAGNGIGRELAILYASKKATVVCWDIDKPNNEETVQTIANLGYRTAYAYTCDVSNYNDVITIYKQVQAEVGDITILINNAGTAKFQPLLEHSKEEIERIMNVNIMSNFWILKAVLPPMIKHNYGHIVAISSVSALGSVPNLVPYSASKCAVRGLMDGLQKEFRVYGNCQIKTTAVYPCPIDNGFVPNPSAKLKNPLWIPFLNQAEVAKSIMRAQTRGIPEVTIPGYWLPIYSFIKLLPNKVEQLLFDFVEFEPQL